MALSSAHRVRRPRSAPRAAGWGGRWGARNPPPATPTTALAKDSAIQEKLATKSASRIHFSSVTSPTSTTRHISSTPKASRAAPPPNTTARAAHGIER